MDQDIYRSNDEIFTTCVHEAAHLVALRHYGGDGVIHVFPTTTGGESTYNGETSECSGKVVVTTQPIGCPERTSIMFGLSGMCGELLFKNENPSWLWQELMNSFQNETETWSEADIRLATCAGDYELVLSDFDECAELIIEQSDVIKELALEAFQRTMGTTF